MSGRFCRILTVALGCLAVMRSLAAVATEEPSAPFSLRRVFVPAERMDQWPLGAQRYLPVEQAEFERLLSAVPQSAARDGLPAVQFTEAQYTARVVNDQLQGEALLQVAPTGDLPASLLWDNCNLAVARARWSRDPNREATLALAPDGRRVLLVEAVDRLRVEWSLAGRRHTAGGLHFILSLPPCVLNQFLLELPERLTPVMANGLVRPAEAGERGQRRWRVEVAGRDRVELSLIPSTVLQQDESAAQVRQTTVYDFSLQGVEVSSQWDLDVLSLPLSQVSLQLDPGLQLIAARCDDQPLSWIPIPLDDQTTRVQLSLPEPLQGSAHQLRVRALAAVALEKSWRLPRMRAEGLFWQQGQVSLLIPTPLALSYFVADGCRQSGAGPLPSPRNGEAVDFEFFSPEGSLDLILQRRKPRLQSTLATTVDLSPSEMKAQVNVELRMTDGELFVLEGEVSRSWTISSVESVPAELVSDWNVEQVNNRSRLEVVLAKALSPTRPVRLKFSLRRLYSALGKRIAVSDLRPLQFSTASERTWLALRAVGPYELHGSRGGLERVDPKKLEPRELELFAERPEWLLDLDNPDVRGARIALTRAKPSYRAAITVEVLAGRESMGETYSIFCIPQATSVDRLLVQFSPGRQADLRWALGAEPDSRLPARRLSAEEQAAVGVPVDDEAWEVVLGRARSEAFELRATRWSRLEGQVPCSLVALPDAGQQRAVVVLRSQIPLPLRVQSRLAPVPPPSGLGGYPPIRRVYRYDPARDLSVAPDPPLRLAWDTENSAQSWAWNCHLESHYQPDGSGTHVAVYRIQQAGGSRIRVSVPTAADDQGLRELWLNQQRAAIQYEEDRRACSLELPPAENRLTLTVHYTTTGPGLRMVGTLRPPLPTISVPLLASRWTVWLPPDYKGYDLQDDGLSGWVRRCFGPLARQPWQNPWNHFWPDLKNIPLPQTEVFGHAQRDLLLQALASAADALGREGRPATWSRWANHKSVHQLPFCLLVDRQELESIGLIAGSPLSLPQSEMSAARITTLLEQENLAILLTPGVALLTTADYAALHQDSLESPGLDRLFVVRGAALAEELEQAARSSSDGLIRVEAWKSEAAALDWSPESGAGSSTGDHVGWHAYRPTLDADGRLGIHYAHRASMQLSGWVLFLLIVAWGWWRRAVNPTRIVLLLALAGTLAWIVPAPCVPLSAGVVLGLVFSLIWRMALGPRPVASTPSQVSVSVPPSTLQAVVQVGSPLLAVAVWLAAASAQAEPAVPAPSGAYDVLVPVDAQQRPAGRLYVPAPLYDRLNQAAQAGRERLRDFLVRNALYRGALVWQASPEQMTLGQLSVSFDLEVFRPGRVRIPLAQQGSQLVAEQALLDGRPIAVAWEADGKAFSFQVEEPGPCRLYCPLRPPLQSVGVQSSFDVEILPLPGARLELLAPAGAPKIQVPSALGAVNWENDPARLVAALGPASRLTVTWDNHSRRSGASEADVEELLWLRVQPTSVVLDLRLEIKGGQGPLREVQLAADPRLRLAPPPENSPIGEVRIEPGQPQIVHLELARPTSESVQLQCSFLLTGSSGLGRIRLPQLETVNARPIKRYLAVSVDPSLTGEAQGPDRLEPLAVPDFLAEWGSAESTPQTAYRLPPGPALWTLATRAAGLRPAVEQTLSVSLDEQQAQLFFEAQVDVDEGRAFHYRLSAPPGLQIQRASLMADGVERVSRWSQQPDGTVCLFLSGAAEGTQELALQGSLPITERGRLALPVVEVQQAQTVSSVIRLLRRPSVSVKIGKTAGLVEVPNPVEDDAQRDLGRLVKAYTVDTRQTPTANLTITPNRPNVAVSQLTMLTAEADRWTCEIRLAAEVKQGLLDQIVLEMPGWWNGPFELDPPEPFQLSEGSGGTQVMTIEPRAAWRGRRPLRLWAPLNGPNGVETPLVQLAPGPAKAHYLALPQGSAWAWDTQGLKPAAIDPPLGQGLGTQMTTFQAVANPYRAALRTASKGTLPQVVLADVCVGWQVDGACRGVAVFDLDGPADGCELALPPGYSLLQLLVGGVAVWPEVVSEGRWRMPTTIPRLPQTIEVLFAGSLAQGSAGEFQFEAPRLVGLEVRRTLWTVAGPSSLVAAQPNGEVNALRADLIRAEQLDAILQRGTTVQGSEPEDLMRWHQLLQRRLMALKATAESALIDMAYAPGEQTEPLAMLRNELQELDRPLSQISQWLARNNPRGGSRAESLEPSLVRLWRSSLDLPRRTRRWAMEGAAPMLSLADTTPQSGPKAALGHVLVWLGLAVAMLWGLSGKTWRKEGQVPLVMVLALGLAWWLWLRPSWLGALMVLVGLMAWLRTRRQRHAPSHSPSAVISVHARA